MNLLEEARCEVADKTRDQIEEETAYKWAARAVAAYERHAKSDGAMWLRDAVTYFDEAVEHAALADRSGLVLHAVRQWVDAHVPRGGI